MNTSRTSTSPRVDIHALITDQIVSAIEAGAGAFKMPWHRARGSLMRRCNHEHYDGRHFTRGAAEDCRYPALG